MKDPVKKFDSLDDANQLIANRSQGILAGYFENEDSEEYLTFSKVSHLLSNKLFYVVLGGESFTRRLYIHCRIW